MQAAQSITRSATKLPAFFLAHGGGPLPVLGDRTHASLTSSLTQLRQKHLQHLDQIPISAILVISAHWEEHTAPTPTSSPSPPMIYDYYGFPPESYKLKYNSPGSPELAKRIASLLQSHNIPCKQDTTRGYDHGTYIPLLLSFPEANIPVVQLSLVSSLDPDLHLKIGEALAPLREEGILLVGSGMSFHNMNAFQSAMRSGNSMKHVDEKSKEFDEHLKHVITGDISQEERRKQLVEWSRWPHARYCHPREEHLLPLMVIAGASLCDKGTTIYNDVLLGAMVSSFKFE